MPDFLDVYDLAFVGSHRVNGVSQLHTGRDGCKAGRLHCASSNKWYWRDIAVKEALRI